MIALIKRILANRDKRDQLLIQHDKELEAYGRLIESQRAYFASLHGMGVKIGDCLCATNDAIDQLWRSSETMAELNAKVGQMTDEWNVDDIKTLLDRGLEKLKEDREAQRKEMDETTASFKESVKAMREAGALFSKSNPLPGDGGTQ